MKRTLIALLVLALLGAGGSWLLWRSYQRFLLTPINLATESSILNVSKGTSLRDLATRLAADGLIGNAHFFIALAYQRNQATAIKAGEYRLLSGMTPGQLLATVVSGKSIQFPITLIEGRTLREVLAAIAQQPTFRSELLAASDADIMTRVGIAESPAPEGWFFPDTYHFERGATDTEVLRRAYRRMRELLLEEWRRRAPDVALRTPYEALILASIIEKETGQASERPAIAGVFARRLRNGMRLQTDPTVIYGLGAAYDGNLRRADLERDTPYNTYTRAGLPPTPIALPSHAAIHAALHPDATDALYFVGRGDGGHYFSATLDEHNCAVRRYQLGGDCDPGAYRR